jgi:hypothetical protein
VSVLIATIRGWPDAHLPIDATRDQLARVGGELVVVDGSGRDAPAAQAIGPDVRWISRPGESVFQLRAAGYAETRGEIVAVTEDHCEPAPNWIEQILVAHDAHPEAIAVGGVVENGSQDHLVDWATFLVTQGPFIAPVPDGPAERLAGAATVSYKRPALERRPDHGSFGAIELFDTAEMRRPGDVLINDNSIVVRHHQSMGIRRTAVLQFHNGRSIAGLRRRAMGAGDWLRVVGFPILPLYRTARTARIAWGKQVPRSIVLVTIPIMTVLHYSQASGELIGYAAGPGASPQHLL